MCLIVTNTRPWTSTRGYKVVRRRPDGTWGSPIYASRFKIGTLTDSNYIGKYPYKVGDQTDRGIYVFLHKKTARANLYDDPGRIIIEVELDPDDFLGSAGLVNRYGETPFDNKHPPDEFGPCAVYRKVRTIGEVK